MFFFCVYAKRACGSYHVSLRVDYYVIRYVLQYFKPGLDIAYNTI